MTYPNILMSANQLHCTLINQKRKKNTFKYLTSIEYQYWKIAGYTFKTKKMIILIKDRNKRDSLLTGPPCSIRPDSRKS